MSISSGSGVAVPDSTRDAGDWTKDTVSHVCVAQVVLALLQSLHATDAKMHGVEYIPAGRSFSISLRVLGGPP